MFRLLSNRARQDVICDFLGGNMFNHFSKSKDQSEVQLVDSESDRRESQSSDVDSAVTNSSDLDVYNSNEPSASKRLLSETDDADENAHCAKEIQEQNIVSIKKSPLGKGACGVVFNREVHGKPFAVKELKSGPDTAEKIKSFKNEIVIMEKLDHLNIVKLHYYVISEDEPTKLKLVLEYMDNDTLKSHFKNFYNRQLAYSIRYTIALNIAKGLKYLHSKAHVIHMDLKSDNILLCNYQGNPYFAKIADFGFALECRDENGKSVSSVFSYMRGTPNYMAPEVLAKYSYRGRVECSPKTDIYSLALILSALVSYQEPFNDFPSNEIGLLYQHVVISNDRLKIPDKTPKKFKEAIEKGWHKDPNNRPDIKQMLTWLKEGKKTEDDKNSQEKTNRRCCCFS